MKLTTKEKKIIMQTLQDTSVNLLETQERILEDVLGANEIQEQTLMRKNLEATNDRKRIIDGLVEKFLMNLCDDLEESIIYIIDINN